VEDSLEFEHSFDKIQKQEQADNEEEKVSSI